MKNMATLSTRNSPVCEKEAISSPKVANYSQMRGLPVVLLLMERK
jgi:hypothetical protein